MYSGVLLGAPADLADDDDHLRRRVLVQEPDRVGRRHPITGSPPMPRQVV